MLVPFAIWIALALQNEKNRFGKFVVPVLVLAMLVVDTFRTSVYLLSPQYSFVSMAHSIRARLAEDGQPEAFVVGHFANTVSMISGISSINSEHGTQSLTWKLDHYRPAYYLRLNGDEPAVFAFMQQRFDVREVGRYQIYAGSVLFYRLDPKKSTSSAIRQPAIAPEQCGASLATRAAMR